MRCIIELNKKELRVSVRKMCVISLACGRFKKLFIIFRITYTNAAQLDSQLASHTMDSLRWHRTPREKRVRRAQQMNSPSSLACLLSFFSFIFFSTQTIQFMCASRSNGGTQKTLAVQPLNFFIFSLF